MNLNHKVLQDWADDFVPAFTELREARLRRSTIQAAGHCVLTVLPPAGSETRCGRMPRRACDAGAAACG